MNPYCASSALSRTASAIFQCTVSLAGESKARLPSAFRGGKKGQPSVSLQVRFCLISLLSVKYHEIRPSLSPLKSTHTLLYANKPLHLPLESTLMQKPGEETLWLTRPHCRKDPTP